jgi:hypothetical protein
MHARAPAAEAGTGRRFPRTPVNIGELVIWRGRAYRLRGFDPMGLVEPNAYLEDVESGERVVVPSDELVPLPRPASG